MLPIYLDYNATTPIDLEVAAAMLPYMVTGFGNPSSTHWFGLQSKKAVEEARAQVAALLGCHADEIIFTSGGSEANNLAIKGCCLQHRDKGTHLIISAVEHPAVVQVAAHLQTLGFELTILPVDGYGMVSPRDLEAALGKETLLVSVMHANNEVGTIEPIAELAAIAHAHGALFHCDAAQSAGKIPVRVDGETIDWSEHFYYKACMFSNVPNFSAVFGYLNASWTLRADIVAEYVCRVLNHMQATGTTVATPALADPATLTEENIFDFSSGYIQRSLHIMPKNADKLPWRLNQNYIQDRIDMKTGAIDDGVLTFGNARAVAAAPAELEAAE